MAVIGLGCGAFTGTSDSVDAPGPGGGSGEAGADAGVDAASDAPQEAAADPHFCARADNASAVFCDDFEDTPRVAIGSPVGQTGTAVVADSPPGRTGRALRVDVPAGNEAARGTRVGAKLPNGEPRLIVDLDAYVEIADAPFVMASVLLSRQLGGFFEEGVKVPNATQWQSVAPPVQTTGPGMVGTWRHVRI
jgi:hypothetical protein